MMIDQLHQFADRSAAQAAFPGEDWAEESWYADGVTILPTTIWLHDPGSDTEGDRGRIAASGYWLGLATTDEAKAAALLALSSCRIAYLRPGEPTPWREAVTWSAMPLDAMTVIECSAFAGSGYVFD